MRQDQRPPKWQMCRPEVPLFHIAETAVEKNSKTQPKDTCCEKHANAKLERWLCDWLQASHDTQQDQYGHDGDTNQNEIPALRSSAQN